MNRGQLYWMAGNCLKHRVFKFQEERLPMSGGDLEVFFLKRFENFPENYSSCLSAVEEDAGVDAFEFLAKNWTSLGIEIATPSLRDIANRIAGAARVNWTQGLEFCKKLFQYSLELALESTEMTDIVFPAVPR